jgi:hypothetical protein
MRRYLGMFASIMLLSACGDGGPSVGLSTRVGTPRGGSAVPGQTEQRLALANGITLERIRISVKKLQLERVEGTSDEERETGPFLIDLAGEGLSGKVVQLRDLDVEPGTYQEIDFDISKVDLTQAGDDEGLRALAQREASVIIDGRIDGQPFSFVSSMTVDHEREARFEITEDGTQNVTINIDPTGWFTDSGGVRLDPRQDGLRSQIENNIKDSIDAFDDDDQDGGEDLDD